MRALMINTKSELHKLLIKKKYIVLTAVSVLMSLIFLGSNMLISKITGGELTIKANLVMTMLRYVTDILIPIVVFMAVTDLFVGEIQENTIKASLMRPLTRLKVMTSKCLAAFLLGCMVMLAMFLSCFVIQLISGNGIKDIPFTFAAYLIDMVPIFALVSLALLINVSVKSPTFAILLCVVVYIFFKYLNIYVSPLGQMIFTSYSQWHRLWIGALLPFGIMMSKIGILVGSVLILYTASYIIFERQDF